VLVSEVINLATVEGGQALRASYALEWIGNAMRLLAQKFDTACVINATKFSITATAEEWNTLPTGCYGVKKVLLDGEKYANYVCDAQNRIMFYSDGTFDVEWMRPAVKPVDVLYTETLEINDMYLDAIAKYVSAKNKISIGVELDIAAKAEQDFWKDALDVDSRLKRTKRSGNRIPAREWR